MVDAINKRSENFTRLLFCSSIRFHRFRVRDVINYRKFDDVIGGRKMSAFIAVVLGLCLAEFWHGEYENAECTASRVISLIGQYGCYILTLLYLYVTLV